MINKLKVPKSEHHDFYDKARHSLTWRIGILFSTVIFILSVITFAINDRFYPYYFSVFSVVMLSLIYMYIKRTYKLVSIFITLCSSGVVVFSVLFISDAIHIIEPLWMIVIILFSFFTLGNRWGVFFLFLNALLYCVYFNYFFENTIDLRLNISTIQIVTMSIEFAFAMFLIGYIMFQFSLVNNHVEKHKKKAFEALKIEKKIVETQNEEKTVLLQEIHHRVKNNLQVVISLLRIQSNELKTKETKQSFDEAISRVMAMSLIHKKMYEKESLVNIDIIDYLNTLIKDLIQTNVTNNVVDHTIKADIERIGSKTIVPLALIINELVSNSLKHAFEEKGKISLSLKNLTDDFFEMIYSDNGSWKSNSNSNSLGLQLIEVFTDQLEGSFERKIDEEGTKYIFRLKSVDQ